VRRVVSDQRGLTLVEILLAATIVAVGLAGLASAIPLSFYGVQEGSQLSIATFLANQRMEQIRRAAWSASPPRDEIGVSPAPGTPPWSDGRATFPDELPLPAPHGQYRRHVRISDCSSGAGCQGVVSPDLRQIVVTVTYAPLTGVGRSPDGKSTTLTLLLAKR
jgi:prepilin-type N-terminal cleavage/methylation domain-containing protein